MSILHLFSALILILSIKSNAYTVQEIIDPRPKSWVLDEKKYLSAKTISELENLCRTVRNSGNGEIMVVLLDSIGSDKHRKFATDLFNTFGVGNSKTDRGILIYAALEQGAAEIILGKGIDEYGDVAKSESIMSKIMVPYFKERKFDDALYNGTHECAKQILGISSIKNVNANFDMESSRGIADTASSAKQISIESPNGSGIGVLCVLGLFIWVFMRFFSRFIPKKCPKCKKKMKLLSETNDDQYLNDGEVMEENLKSVNYDIWLCTDCKEYRKVKIPGIFSKYTKCPSCKFKTLKTKSTVIVKPTVSTTGTTRVDKNCKKCSYSRSDTEIIQRLESSSSSGGLSGSSGGSSSGSGASGRW
jgi:uncharacterized protein